MIITWFIFSCSQTDDLDKYPGACLKVVALPLYQPQKGVDPGQGGTRTVIGQLGDSFPPFDEQGSCLQDVWSVLDVPH